MEAAAASLLEGLAPFIGHLTRDALMRFFRARVKLRSSVFRTPLDQLARDLIKSDPFSVKLFCPKVVEKVVETFGKFRDNRMTWDDLLLRKTGVVIKRRGRREAGPLRGPLRARRPFRGLPGGSVFRQQAPQPYGQPFRGHGARGAYGRGRRGGRRGTPSTSRQ